MDNFLNCILKTKAVKPGMQFGGREIVQHCKARDCIASTVIK